VNGLGSAAHRGNLDTVRDLGIRFSHSGKVSALDVFNHHDAIVHGHSYPYATICTPAALRLLPTFALLTVDYRSYYSFTALSLSRATTATHGS